MVSINDKIYHLIVCFIASLIDTWLAVGLALGKEYGDMNAQGNHWCWYDLLADGLGVILGTIVRLLVL